MCGTIPPFSHTSSRCYELEQEQFKLTVKKSSVQFLNRCCGFSDRRSETLTAECFHLSECLINEFIWMKPRYSPSPALNTILGTNYRTAATGVTKKRLPEMFEVLTEVFLKSWFWIWPSFCLTTLEDNNDSPKHCELLAQRHGVTFQCAWNLTYYLLRVWQKACNEKEDDRSFIIWQNNLV
jgi:hypothetical protein